MRMRANKYECTMDQELADTDAYVPGRCFVSIHQVAALLCMKWYHSHQLTRVSRPKPDKAIASKRTRRKKAK